MIKINTIRYGTLTGQKFAKLGDAIAADLAENPVRDSDIYKFTMTVEGWSAKLSRKGWLSRG